MAVNKVIYGSNTLIDITDTTAEAADVESGKVFYSASGTRTVGTSTTAQDLEDLGLVVVNGKLNVKYNTN